MLGYFQTHPLAGQFAGIIRAETETWTDGMWRGRIWGLLEAISTVAIFLAERDESVVVERESLISMLPLDRIIGLVHLGQWTRPDDTTLDVNALVEQSNDPAAALAVWREAISPLRLYLASLPGYETALAPLTSDDDVTADRVKAQGAFLRQHGYIVTPLVEDGPARPDHPPAASRGMDPPR